jgi:hypothetical protein
MPDKTHEYQFLDDEPDTPPQPVIDNDVVSALGDLWGAVDDIAQRMDSAGEEISRALNETLSDLRAIQYTLSGFLTVIVIGFFVIVGTLRHWF